MSEFEKLTVLAGLAGFSLSLQGWLDRTPADQLSRITAFLVMAILLVELAKFKIKKG